jgi:hypothetical protein
MPVFIFPSRNLTVSEFICPVSSFLKLNVILSSNWNNVLLTGNSEMAGYPFSLKITCPSTTVI